MLSIFAMQVFHLSTSLALCIDIFLDGPTVARSESWWGETTMLALLFFFMAFDAVSLLLLVQLVWFHLGLQRQQITTYQYIIRDAQKRRDRTKLQRELDHQRATALAKAQREGRCLDRCRLVWGEESRKMGCGDTCDPLKMPTEVNDDAGFATALGGGGANGYNHHGGTNSDADEEAPPSNEDDDDAPPAEQALPRTDEPPGVQFLRVQNGQDIMAEPGLSGDDTEEEKVKSQPWEIPEVDVYVSEDEDDEKDEAAAKAENGKP